MTLSSLSQLIYLIIIISFCQTGDRETVAIKCVLKKSLNKLSTENLLTEIELLKLLNHEHIVQLKDFDWDQNYIYIITEYCSGGDLMTLLRQKRALHESLVRRFLQQIGNWLFLSDKLLTSPPLKFDCQHCSPGTEVPEREKCGTFRLETTEYSINQSATT